MARGKEYFFEACAGDPSLLAAVRSWLQDECVAVQGVLMNTQEDVDIHRLQGAARKLDELERKLPQLVRPAQSRK